MERWFGLCLTESFYYMFREIASLIKKVFFFLGNAWILPVYGDVLRKIQIGKITRYTYGISLSIKLYGKCGKYQNLCRK
jgi:hypothetical protein